MTEEVKLKIIKIIDDSTLIGNKGKNAEIEINDSFKILGEEGTEIIDPDSSVLLGYMPEHKGTVFAYEVYDNFTVFKSKYNKPQYTKSSIQNIQTAALGLASTLSVPGYYEELNVDYDQVTGEDKTTPIRIGDILSKIQ